MEDEAHMSALIKKKVSDLAPEIEIVGEADNIEMAQKLIIQLQPDLVFLDIKIKQYTGFNLLENLAEINFGIIFITAYDRYALRAIKFSAIDYILKPIKNEELLKAIDKASRSIENKQQKDRSADLLRFIQNPLSQVNRIGIPVSDGFEFIKVEEIIYCLSDRNYTIITKIDGSKLVSSYTLKEFDHLLSELGFFRAHKSHLINLNHMVRYSKKDGNTVVMIDGAVIPIARTKREELLKAIKRL